MAAAPPPLSSERPLPALFTIGDFDGDQQPDTLYQCVFSGFTKTKITHAPASPQTEHDSVVAWFARRGAEVLLTLGRPARDTLHLGFGQGLYCLFKLGDTNSDGRDEVALSVDYLDESRLNSCQIITVCRGKLRLIKSFSIYEGAFDEAPATPVTIPGFLVRRKSHWLYADYLEDAAADSLAVEGQLQPLELSPCP